MGVSRSAACRSLLFVIVDLTADSTDIIRDIRDSLLGGLGFTLGLSFVIVPQKYTG